MLRDSSHLRITQSVFFGNEATFGRAVYVLGGPSFENVLMPINKGLGGGLYVNASQPTLMNCTIASNKDEGNNAGGIYNANAVTTVKNSILLISPDRQQVSIARRRRKTLKNHL